jgi:transcriptional regulator
MEEPMARSKKRLELLRGTLDLLVLQTLQQGPMHGYAVAARIQEGTDDVLKIEEGSLYPALHRMERRGWIEAEWGHTDARRRARFYRLSAAGRRQLEDELQRWRRFSAAVEKVIEPA